MMSLQAVAEMCKMFGTHRRLVVLAVLLAACYFHITGASKRSRPPPKPLVFFGNKNQASPVDATWADWEGWRPDCKGDPNIRQSRVRKCNPGRYGGLRKCCPPKDGASNWFTNWFRNCPAHEIRQCTTGGETKPPRMSSDTPPPKDFKDETDGIVKANNKALQIEEENEEIKRDNEKEEEDNTTLIVAVVAVVGVVAVVAGVAVFVIKKKKSAAGAAAGGAPPPQQGPGAGANDGRMDVEGGQGSQGGSRRSSRSSQGRGSQGSGRSSRSSSSGSRGSQKSRGSKVDSKRSGSQY